jgi:hypothetical protein
LSTPLPGSVMVASIYLLWRVKPRKAEARLVIA